MYLYIMIVINKEFGFFFLFMVEKKKKYIYIGVWFMHCHLDRHMSWGMTMAFIVKNGKSPNARILPPPPDMPPCWRTLLQLIMMIKSLFINLFFWFHPNRKGSVIVCDFQDYGTLKQCPSMNVLFTNRLNCHKNVYFLWNNIYRTLFFFFSFSFFCKYIMDDTTSSLVILLGNGELIMTILF